MKHLSSIAKDVIQRCAQKLDVPMGGLVEEFDAGWRQEIGDYSSKLLEFCCSKAMAVECPCLGVDISDGSFSRFTFDMMLAWETPTSQDEDSHRECKGKEAEERKTATEVTEVDDDIPLFYSDIMPLLVNNEPSVGEDAFVWFGSLVPLVVDVVNGRFTFETLTASAGNKLYYPAYDKFLKEMDKCIRHLQKQAKPKGVELADDELILHVEGTITSQRVVRHIKGTSWPGRLTLTNHALYFEAKGVITYDDALKIDLSENTKHSVKSAATGPWGAPLFDKAIIYESPELSEEIVLEFPEMTSSTRRDHWLALIKEIILLHQFLSKHNLESPEQVWEMHARTIFGIIRLHAAREMLRISPPVPTRFLIFALFDEIPKGDYVLEELAESLKKVQSGVPCNAGSILRVLCMPELVFPSSEVKAGTESTSVEAQDLNQSLLHTAINQSREETKQMDQANATTEVLREEGIAEKIHTLLELLKPLQGIQPLFKEVTSWRKPAVTLTLMATVLVVVYTECFGLAAAACILWLVFKIFKARHGNAQDKTDEMVVCKPSDQKTTVEIIVDAQQGLRNAYEMIQEVNIAILKIRSIAYGIAPKHADMVMMGMMGLAIVLAVIPLKYIFMVIIVHSFIMTTKLGEHVGKDQGNRRLKEWWDSIPIVPVRVVDQPALECPS